jgi:hypothetical protein
MYFLHGEVKVLPIYQIYPDPARNLSGAEYGVLRAGSGSESL